MATNEGADRVHGSSHDPVAGATPEVEDLVRVVAVDGPAGSGKSTVARETASALGWRFVDTGATYRALTLAVIRAGVDPADAAAVARVAAEVELVLVTDPHAPRVLLDGEDVSIEIRGPAVTASVSAVSGIPAVRARLVALQRRAMGTSGAVVEGRDIATVVAPAAAVKVYLDARPDVRARRRAGDVDSGVVSLPETLPSIVPSPQPEPALVDLEQVVRADLARRDALDNQTNRLQVSDGALHLDTSDLTLDEVVFHLVDLVKEAGLSP